MTGILCVFLSGNMTAQADFRIQVGINAAIGLPINRFGICLETDYYQDWFALNSGIRLHINGTNYGPAKGRVEAQFYVGTWLGYGPNKTSNEMLSALVSTIQRQYALGYQINRYQDSQKTSQWTGTVKLKFGQFYFLTENDALVPGKPHDRYRTGAVSVIWSESDRLYELRTVLWHGETRGAKSIRDTEYPCRFGYRDFTSCPYGNYSNGVLAFQIHQQIPFGQIVQLGAGLDAEQIRNVVQNKLIHDMWFFPTNWTPVRNLHYPMLDTSGALYLYGADQKIRPLRPYFLLGLNQSGFY